MRRLLPLRKTADGQILLNLGCGARSHAEWNNLDFVAAAPSVVQHNILSGLPYEAESFDAVYSAHFIEHFSPEEARAVLAESFRRIAEKWWSTVRRERTRRFATSAFRRPSAMS